MASACVNSVGAVPLPESAFLDIPTACPPYGWIGPRISFSRDLDGLSSAGAAKDFVVEMRRASTSAVATAMLGGSSDPDGGHKDLPDFEFLCLGDPVNMLPADELFSDGKLVPLQLAAVRPQAEVTPAAGDEIRPLETAKSHCVAEILRSDAVAPSPRAPRCSSRWRELLGLKKQQNPKQDAEKLTSPSLDSYKNQNPKPRSFRQLLHRHGKSSDSGDASLNLPLLRESDSESLSISSRRSLSSSSSSSGTDHEDFPRFSLDSDRPNEIPILLVRAPPRVRVSRPRSSVSSNVGEGRARIARGVAARQIGEHPLAAPPPPPLAAPADSPRMNASGKVVFQGLERSSSSPGSFNGGPRLKYRAMERSYSAGVRVPSVLNVVPVRSIRGSTKPGSVFGFGQIFTPQKKEAEASTRTAKPFIQTAVKHTTNAEK